MLRDLYLETSIDKSFYEENNNIFECDDDYLKFKYSKYFHPDEIVSLCVLLHKNCTIQEIIINNYYIPIDTDNVPVLTLFEKSMNLLLDTKLETILEKSRNLPTSLENSKYHIYDSDEIIIMNKHYKKLKLDSIFRIDPSWNMEYYKEYLVAMNQKTINVIYHRLYMEDVKFDPSIVPYNKREALAYPIYI